MKNTQYKISHTAEEIWNMEKKREFADDIECHYKGLLNFLDILYYRNGNSAYPEVLTRHTVFYLALTMPSLAIIDSSRTKEITYNLHIAGETLENPLLTHVLDGYDSKSIRMVRTGFIYALHKMVGGMKLNDVKLHSYAEKVYQRIIWNGKSTQNVYAIETIQGTYQILPNLEALMLFKIHDMCYGSRYFDKVGEKVLSFITTYMVDEETGLFHEFYKTGAFGIENEFLSSKAAWHSTELKTSVNAMAIPFMHLFDKKRSERAWSEFKRRYSERILNLTSDNIADGVGKSYLTQLAPITESLYGALLTAKEMRDKDFFEEVQKHIILLGKPHMREGKIFFDELGDMKVLQGHFIFFARAHVGWHKILNHNWENYYNTDYNKVR